VVAVVAAPEVVVETVWIEITPSPTPEIADEGDGATNNTALPSPWPTLPPTTAPTAVEVLAKNTGSNNDYSSNTSSLEHAPRVTMLLLGAGGVTVFLAMALIVLYGRIATLRKLPPVPFCSATPSKATESTRTGSPSPFRSKSSPGESEDKTEPLTAIVIDFDSKLETTPRSIGFGFENPISNPNITRCSICSRNVAGRTDLCSTCSRNVIGRSEFEGIIFRF